MSTLSQKQCIPCEKGTPALTQVEAEEMLEQVPGWELGENMLSRRLRFKDFKEAMRFVNRVAEIAEEEGHHPDIHISWNRVRLTLATHIIKGLSENDFILASKINVLQNPPVHE